MNNNYEPVSNIPNEFLKTKPIDERLFSLNINELINYSEEV